MAFSVAKNRAYFEENIVGQTISNVSKTSDGYLQIHLTSNQYFSTWYEVHGYDYDTYILVKVFAQEECIFESETASDDLREEFGQWIEPKNESDEIGAERFADLHGQKIVALKQKYGSHAFVLENGCELQSQAGFKEHYDTLIHADGTVIAKQSVVQK